MNEHEEGGVPQEQDSLDPAAGAAGRAGTRALSAENFQSVFLAERVGATGVVLCGVFFGFVSAALVYFLVKFWPGQPDPVDLLLLSPFGADVELRLILVAAGSGALGACVHGITSFASYLGNRKLLRSWLAWYFMRPLIGGALALIFYFLIRGGFLSPQADGQQISAFGVAAVAGLVGLFSKQATEKLKDAFEQIFPVRDGSSLEDKLGE